MIRGCLLVLGPPVSPRVAWDKPRCVRRSRSCRGHQLLAQGEPPRPPAPSEGPVVVVAPIPTGARCWKTPEMLGTGRRWHGKGCREVPQQRHRALARCHPRWLQRFGLLSCRRGGGGGGGGKEPIRCQWGIVATGWGPGRRAGPPVRGAGR